MKKGIKLLVCALCAVFLFSCNTPTNDKGGGNPQVTKTLTEQIEDANGTIDFNGAKISEDASVDEKVTIKNLNIDGKTLTVYTSGVVLENVKNATVIVADGDVTLKNCTNIIKLEVKKNTSDVDDIIIDASQIEIIEINKDGIRIVLKDKDTKVAEIIVSAEDTTLEAEKKETEDAPVVETLTVTEDADNVSISGGKIENLVVETSDDTAEEDKPVVTLTGETEITKIEGDTTVYVTEEVKDTVKLPEDAKTEEVTEKAWTLYNTDSVKKEYTVGDNFDYTNLAVKVTYSNGSIKVVQLTKANCELKDFDTSVAGTYTVSVKYKEKLIGSFEIKVSKPALTNGTAREYIDAALEILSDSKGMPDFDLAVSYFKKAYEADKTDETKLYYALAELASISTDSSVAKLLKENFGLKNYPSSMNALFSGSWMKEYLYTRACQTATFVKDPNGNYVRGNTYYSDSYDNVLSFYSKYTKYDDYWISPDYYGYYSSHITPSDTGDTMFTISYPDKTWQYDNETGNYVEKENEDAINEYKAFIEANKDCLYSIKETKTVQLPRAAFGYGYKEKELIPEFTVIDQNDPNYQATLYNSLKTTETMSYLMLANFFNCNAEGFNKLIDNILNVYNNRFENAKALVADLSQDSITVPADIIFALGLDKWFGENTVIIGKAEVDVCFAAMDIYKGLFQWFSSYDLSLDLDVVKDRMFQLYNPNDPYASWGSVPTRYAEMFRYGSDTIFAELYSLTNAKTFTVRSETAMAASKNTILNAVNKALASYEYITGDSKTYPSEVKEKIKDYAGPAYEMVAEIAKALEDGTVFEVKNSDGKTQFAIDLGKFFTAGYLSNLVEKDSKGDIKFTANGYQYMDTTGYSYREVMAPFKDDKEYEFDISNKYNEVKRVLKSETEALDWDEEISLRYIYGYASIKLSKIIDLMPGMIELPEQMRQIYDETSGILKMPLGISTWINIYKPLDTMEGQWFQIEYDNLSEFFDIYDAEEDDFVNIAITKTIETENSRSTYTGIVFVGDVKTIKESGFVTYGVFNEYYPTTIGQYLTKETASKKFDNVPDDKVNAKNVKFYAYSNMTGDRPGDDLVVQLRLCKKPISYSYSYENPFVAYYDSDKNTFTYGYAKAKGVLNLTSGFSKVE